jgi:hypothetical protein
MVSTRKMHANTSGIPLPGESGNRNLPELGAGPWSAYPWRPNSWPSIPQRQGCFSTRHGWAASPGGDGFCVSAMYWLKPDMDNAKPTRDTRSYITLTFFVENLENLCYLLHPPWEGVRTRTREHRADFAREWASPSIPERANPSDIARWGNNQFWLQSCDLRPDFSLRPRGIP